MIKTAERLNSVQEYYFSRKLREVRQLISEGKPVINMGIGSPDLAPDITVIEAMQKALFDDKAHEYQSYQGLPELRKGIANFYATHFHVNLDFNTEILPLMEMSCIKIGYTFSQFWQSLIALIFVRFVIK